MTISEAKPRSDSALLEAARGLRASADAAEAGLLQTAVDWATAHPAPSTDECAVLAMHGDQPFTVAGPGAPLIAEFCVAEFAVALGMPTDTGRAYLGEAVELAHRLPRTWRRVQAGDLAAWRARRIARETIALSFEAAMFVDAQVAPYAHRLRPAEVDRLVAEAVGRFMPEEAEDRRRRAADGRHLTIQHTQVSFVGTAYVHGELDLADALDLETAVSHGASVLAACGSTESLDVRRSQAVGELARRQLSLDLEPATGTGESSTYDGTGDRTAGPAARQNVVHVHLSPGSPFARVESRGRRLVTAEQVRDWLGATGTELVVRPVIDLDERLHVSQYEVPDRMVRQAEERDLTCVFPWCTRRADQCDTDHVVPYAAGGATSTDNLAPLCRRHHRLKTHSAWAYTVLEPGSYLWHSPHGYQFLRDASGTTDVSRPRPG